MKFDINNPAFLQSACSSPSLPTIVARSSAESAEFEINMGESTTILVTRTQNGVLSTFSEETSNSGYIRVLCDPNTDIIISGDLISLSDTNDNDFYESLVYLDISKCKTLTEFSLGSGTTQLMTIRANVTNDDIALGLESALDNSLNTGVLYLKSGSSFNQQVSDVAEGKGWSVEYF